MNKKPEYIVKKENESEIFSVVKFEYFDGKSSDFFKNKKFKIVYLESMTDNVSILKHQKIIYETEQKFYLYVENGDSQDVWFLTIYYQPEQLNELRFFINQLNKQYEKNKIK